MSDGEGMLLQGLAADADSDAATAVIEQYADLVFAASRRVLGNDAEAADVAQETFFHFCQSADRIRGSVAGWLHRVATRRAIDRVRQNTSRRRREEAYVAEVLPETDRWQEIEPLLDEALDELPDSAREVLVLHYLERQSTTTLAALNGISQPTMSRRLASALDQLRERLRARGVTVGVVVLAFGLAGQTYAAPSELVRSLGKIALAHAASTSASSAAAIPISANLLKAGVATLALGLIATTGWMVWPPAPETRTSSAPATPALAPPHRNEPITVADPSSTPKAFPSAAVDSNRVLIVGPSPANLSPLDAPQLKSMAPGLPPWATGGRPSQGGTTGGSFGVGSGGAGGGGGGGGYVGGSAGVAAGHTRLSPQAQRGGAARSLGPAMRRPGAGQGMAAGFAGGGSGLGAGTLSDGSGFSYQQTWTSSFSLGPGSGGVQGSRDGFFRETRTLSNGMWTVTQSLSPSVPTNAVPRGR